MSDSLRHRGPQPTRLLYPWDSPGENTGVGCHFLLLVGYTAFQILKVVLGPVFDILHQKIGKHLLSQSILKVQHAQIPVPRAGQKQREKVRNEEVCPPLIPSSVPLSLPPFCIIAYFPQYKHNLCSLYKLFKIQKYIMKTQ